MKKTVKRFTADMKRNARFLAGAIGGSAVMRPLAGRMFLRHINIVYYHLIGPSQPYYPLRPHGEYTVERFSRELARLKEVFTFVPLKEACNADEGTVRSDKPLLALTFDDGFRLSGLQLLQVLAHHGIRATQFLITSCIDNRSLMWRNKIFAIATMVPEAICVPQYNALAGRLGLRPIRSRADLRSASSAWAMSQKDELADELWRACDMPPLAEFLDEHRPYMTWQEVEAWLGAGHSIGLHTHTHPYCSRLTDDEIEEEIIRPAAALRNRFKLDYLPFSYPFGDRMSAAREQALIAGSVLDCALGNRGFARRGTAPHRLERAGIEEGGIGWPVFGRPMILYGVTGAAARQ